MSTATLSSGNGLQFPKNAFVDGKLNTNALRACKDAINVNATLRKDEWELLDTELVRIARETLTGITDLQSAGLTVNLGGLGVIESQYEQESDMDPATLSLGGETKGNKDRAEFNLISVPIPIVHKEFSINIRQLEASRRFGQSIDVTTGALASRKVADLSEDLLFSSTVSFQVGGNPLYTYLTHPNRNTVTLANAWDVPAGDPIGDVRAMLQASYDANHNGPFVLYYPKNYRAVLEDDYKAESDKTILQRLSAFDAITSVKAADRLPSDTVVLVQMTRDVVDLAIGQTPTNLEWTTDAGMSNNFKVMSAWAPRIKADFIGQSGVTVLS